jgi:hypothetical protein
MWHSKFHEFWTTHNAPCFHMVSNAHHMAETTVSNDRYCNPDRVSVGPGIPRAPARVIWRGPSRRKLAAMDYTAWFFKSPQLFRELAMARADGTLSKLLYRLGRVDVLIVDDWAMAPLADPERRDFLEICDERYQSRSTLLTSQLPVSAWHAQIGEPTVADSILDRLVHNAHRIELQGDSMRKKRPAKASAES